MSSNSTMQGERCNYKDIYELLERLCKTYAGDRYRDVLRYITHYVSNCPGILGTSLPYDESTMVKKITQYLKNSPNGKLTPATVTGLAAALPAGKAGTDCSDSMNLALFASMYDNLKTGGLSSQQRIALLSFLFFTADTKSSKNVSSGELGKTPGATSSGATDRPALQFIRANIRGADKTGGVFITKCQEITTNAVTLKSGSELPAVVETSLKSTLSNAGMRSKHTALQPSSQCPCVDIYTAAVAADREDIAMNIEDEVVQNAIYAFTGVEGRFLKKDLITGYFRLDPRAKELNVIQAGMLLRLSQLGYYHNKVQMFADPEQGRCALGLMGQGFTSALRNELTQFYGMVSVLQEQFTRQRNPAQCVFKDEEAFNRHRKERLTLLKMLSWSIAPLQRLQWLANIAETCQEKKGGALASTVHSFLSHGSPMVKSLVKELLLALCAPLYDMLSRWLLEGEINDPFGEFFVEVLSEMGTDRLWHDKYRVREPMLPDFISADLAHKILVTGKSKNFLAEICKDMEPIRGRNELDKCIQEHGEQIFSTVGDTRFHAAIDEIYVHTSKRVLDIVMGPHKLLQHLQAMRDYLLLGQGDFVSILMDQLKSELDKPAKDLYSYDISSIMENAMRTINAHQDDPEILNYLDVRLMTPCDGDIGWDIISLQYTVRGPLQTMLEPSMSVYQVLFKPLWRMKHMEFLLCSKVWNDQKCNEKLVRSMFGDVERVLYHLHLFTAEMMHFISEMQYYLLFEVIECSWEELRQRVNDAKALDDVLTAHDEFLQRIRVGTFLDASSSELCQNLETVYESIIRLESWQDKFFSLCFQEREARKSYETDIAESEKEGKFGVTAEKQQQREQDAKMFEQTLISYQKTMNNISVDYEKAVHAFLLALNSSIDPNLQLFGMRLDFNEYYKKRDQRLGVPLTFEHMRLSNVFYKAGSTSMGGSTSLGGAGRYSMAN